MKEFSYLKSTEYMWGGDDVGIVNAPTLRIWIEGIDQYCYLIYHGKRWSYSPDLDRQGLTEADELRIIVDKLDELNNNPISHAQAVQPASQQ